MHTLGPSKQLAWPLNSALCVKKMKYLTIILFLFSSSSCALENEESSVMISIKKTSILVNMIKLENNKTIESAFNGITNPIVHICVDHDAPHSVLIDTLESIKDKTNNKVHMRAESDCQ